VRARLLREAGVRFGVRPADVDEEVVKSTLHQQGLPVADFALALAEAKALNVSAVSPQALVLGCDQTLLCGTRLFDKPSDVVEARENLTFLRGKEHQLVTACVLAKDGKPVWRYVERAHLTMRAFSDDFLDRYLKSEGSQILSSVGCYQLEGLGAQLFSAVSGDYFTVLGLPLIPLLGALRDQGVVAP
jgi:septum formation protein